MQIPEYIIYALEQYKDGLYTLKEIEGYLNRWVEERLKDENNRQRTTT